METVTEAERYELPVQTTFTMIIASTSFFFSLQALSRWYVHRNWAPLKYTTEAKLLNSIGSLVHAFVSALIVAIDWYTRPESRPFFGDMIDDYTHLTQLALSFTAGYAIYDAYDLVTKSGVAQMWDLLVHHSVMIISCEYALYRQICVSYTAAYLFAEINSVFLHMRQVLLLLDVPRWKKRSLLNTLVNYITFFAFRLLYLAFLFYWLYWNYHRLTVEVVFVAFWCNLIVFVMQPILLYRLIRADMRPQKIPSQTKLNFR